jgi:archaemetzincin
MDSHNIILISFGYFEEDFIQSIAETVVHEFNLPVNVREGHLDLSEFYDAGRRQYNGTKLLTEVDSLYALDGNKTIGLFSIDLFIPILTYIFGQAFLNGRSGIASFYRLSNERYGINTDNKLIHDRFQKEVVHELGHTFGLVHCYNSTCVMRASTYVEDIDQKTVNLCPRCRKEISSILI